MATTMNSMMTSQSQLLNIPEGAGTNTSSAPEIPPDVAVMVTIESSLTAAGLNRPGSEKSPDELVHMKVILSIMG